MHFKNSSILHYTAALVVSTPLAFVQAATEHQSSDPMTVTARLWEERPIDIPASVKVISNTQLQPKLTDIDQYISNVRIEQSSVQKRAVIRGSSGYDTGLQDPVAFYVDGVALPLGGNQFPPIFNLQQLEIVKGPQGALYGRNSESGVIKITSLAPTIKPTFSLGVRSGVTDGANGKKAAHIINLRASNTLIEDRVAAAVALQYEDTQGPFLNKADGSESGGSIENWLLKTSVDTFVSPQTKIAFRSHLERQNAGKSRLRFSNGPNATERFVTNNDISGSDKKSSAIHSLTVNHQFDNLSFTSITGLTNYQRQFTTDLDVTTAPSPATNYDLKDKMFSQEFRIESNWEDDFRWLAGVYLYKQDTEVSFSIGGTPMLKRATRITDIDQQGVAGFGQFEYALGENWDVSLATRVEHVKKQGKQSYQALFGQSYAANKNSTKLLPKATLSYHINDDALVYGSIAKGYTPGGFNYASAQNIASFTYDAQTSQNIELGYKASLLSNQLSVGATLFQITTKDKQVVDLMPGFVQSISNAAETKSYGLELDADYRFSGNLSVYAQVGLMKASAEQYTTNVFRNGAFVPRSLSGNDLPLSPRVSYAAGLKYDRGQGVFGDLRVKGSGSYYFDAANTMKQSGYVRVDSQIGYHFSNASISLIGENLFDAKVVSRAVNTRMGAVVEDGAPRYFGVKLAASW
ncbi:MAG: hypothetical protein OFPII_00130 [Osedax symbiont Rs1]|nr:MAG: hypothetical protein OFPII_00130 [Osedax symbiont Rs1]